MKNYYLREQARRTADTRAVLEAVHAQAAHSLEVLRMRGAARDVRKKYAALLAPTHGVIPCAWVYNPATRVREFVRVPNG